MSRFFNFKTVSLLLANRFFLTLGIYIEKSRNGPTRAAFPKIVGINVYSCHIEAKEQFATRKYTGGG
jgi:hypothetical protein